VQKCLEKLKKIIYRPCIKGFVLKMGFKAPPQLAIAAGEFNAKPTAARCG
jgi:hypothetical protein